MLLVRRSLFCRDGRLLKYYIHVITSMSSNNQQVAIVTGSSSGIGLETALALARSGFLTYATMRNLGKRNSIQPVAEKERLPIRVVQLDVTDENSIKKAIQSI